MTELKTLKDFINAGVKGGGIDLYENGEVADVSVDFIKNICQTIIEQIKKYRKVQKMIFWENDDRFVEGKITGLMHFFNIKEDDLK